ncbi:hypothetical protein [Pendulispora albinea]|uniref:PCI domain-containing protein n=1 Tax=Pendulispora albinea TaxID=2741071 RepID=A0ABZ2M2U6_9BACT
MVDVGAQATAEIMKHVPCPHCGAQARMESDVVLRWVCAVCGGPRVPVEDAAAHSEREREQLLRAGHAKKMAFAHRAFGIGLSLTGTMLAALGAALATVAGAVALFMVLAAVVALVFGITYVRSAKRRDTEAKEAVFEAWETVAEGLLRARAGTDQGEVTGEQIARAMHTSVEDVERMMSFLAVDNRARIVVKDAELVYTSGDMTSQPPAAEEVSGTRIEGDPQEEAMERAILESEEADADAAHPPGTDARRR